MSMPAAILATIAALALAWLAWPLILNWKRDRIVLDEPLNDPENWGV